MINNINIYKSFGFGKPASAEASASAKFWLRHTPNIKFKRKLGYIEYI